MISTAQRRTPRLPLEPLRQRLQSAANQDGTWGYYPGKSGRLEPTCWAALALGPSALETIGRMQRPDGLLVDPGVPGPNFAWNGLALFLANRLSQAPKLPASPAPRLPSSLASPWASKLATALVAAKGVQLPAEPPGGTQDNALQAWPWVENTFSWVEPTGWCLLALKSLGSRGADAVARIKEAEALLVNRACTAGGWNYGNSAVFSQDLRPYVPTTALALLALQDQPRLPVMERGLTWLQKHATSERSAHALSLAAICLAVFKRPATDVLNRLQEQEARTGFLGNSHLLAAAVYALSIPEHGAAAFRLGS